MHRQSEAQPKTESGLVTRDLRNSGIVMVVVTVVFVIVIVSVI